MQLTSYLSILKSYKKVIWRTLMLLDVVWEANVAKRQWVRVSNSWPRAKLLGYWLTQPARTQPATSETASNQTLTTTLLLLGHGASAEALQHGTYKDRSLINGLGNCSASNNKVAQLVISKTSSSETKGDPLFFYPYFSHCLQLIICTFSYTSIRDWWQNGKVRKPYCLLLTSYIKMEINNRRTICPAL